MSIESVHRLHLAQSISPAENRIRRLIRRFPLARSPGTDGLHDSPLEGRVCSEPVSESGRGIRAQFQNIYGMILEA